MRSRQERWALTGLLVGQYVCGQLCCIFADRSSMLGGIQWSYSLVRDCHRTKKGWNREIYLGDPAQSR